MIPDRKLHARLFVQRCFCVNGNVEFFVKLKGLVADARGLGLQLGVLDVLAILKKGRQNIDDDDSDEKFDNNNNDNKVMTITQ